MSSENLLQYYSSPLSPVEIINYSAGHVSHGLGKKPKYGKLPSTMVFAEICENFQS